jgi:phenylalanine-4-hydroxylase
MAATGTNKNRYANAPRNEDWTIAQDWPSYSGEEHDRWRRLYARQAALLPGRACDEYLEAMSRLDLQADRIPDFEALSERLASLTGWRIAPVAGLIPDDAFFEHLANRRFPAGAFIRPEEEFDYLQEPDIFHDVFGHTPLLANPAYASFLQAYGEAGRRALGRGQLHNLARLYWYTVEFGLMLTPQGLRIFGAGLMSSPGETLFCLDNASPNRIHFDLFRVMRTRYIISDYQQSYFVIESFERLLAECARDFGPLYDALRGAPDLEPDETAPQDAMISKGDLAYFVAREARPA